MGQFPNCEIKLCDLEVARVIQDGESIREIIGTPDYVGESVRVIYKNIAMRLISNKKSCCSCDNKLYHNIEAHVIILPCRVVLVQLVTDKVQFFLLPLKKKPVVEIGIACKWRQLTSSSPKTQLCLPYPTMS